MDNETWVTTINTTYSLDLSTVTVSGGSSAINLLASLDIRKRTFLLAAGVNPVILSSEETRPAVHASLMNFCELMSSLAMNFRNSIRP